MPVETKAECRVVRPGGTYDGKQGFSAFEGIARESVGASGMCLPLIYTLSLHHATVPVQSSLEEFTSPVSGRLFLYLYIVPVMAYSDAEAQTKTTSVLRDAGL